MTNEKNTKIFIYIALVLLILALDRISKTIILNILENDGKVDIYINSFINLFLVWNKGIGFGLFSFDSQLFYHITSFIIVLIILYLIYLFFYQSGIRKYFISSIIYSCAKFSIFSLLFYKFRL